MRRKEVKPLVTSRRRVWRQKISWARRMPIVSMSFSSLSFRSLSWRIECPWRNVSLNFGSWPGRDRRNRSRNAAEGRCWTSVCAFSSEDSDAECRVTITIPCFCKEETSTAIGVIKEKKKSDVQNWKKSKDKKSSKIQPAPVLVRMFWGRFRTRSDSIGHARGRFRTRSDSIGRASQRPWTRLDKWPDPVRSRPASDTFPDPSPESDSSRFVRSLNLPIVGLDSTDRIIAWSTV